MAAMTPEEMTQAGYARLEAGKASARAALVPYDAAKKRALAAARMIRETIPSKRRREDAYERLVSPIAHEMDDAWWSAHVHDPDPRARWERDHGALMRAAGIVH